jgi:hypothetical protein
LGCSGTAALVWRRNGRESCGSPRFLPANVQLAALQPNLPFAPLDRLGELLRALLINAAFDHGI